MPANRQGVKRQHPNSGVRLDFENLLKKFTETETVRYEQFAEVWRSMKFSFLCAGRQNDREVREFMDECFSIALLYFLPPYNFQVRVGGLYLLYGLYFTQQCFPKSLIRVTPEQWKQILAFQEDAHSQQHLDVDFCFEKLLFNHAFLYVATAKEVYPRSSDAVETPVASQMPDELKESQECLQTMFSVDALEELSAVHTEYEKIKIGLAGPDAERPVRSLDMIQSKLVSNIVSRLEAHKEKLTKLKQQPKRSVLDLSDEEDPTIEPSLSNVAKLKAKAFSGLGKQTKARRHRNVTMDSSSDKSPKKKKGISYEELSDMDDDDDDDDKSEGHSLKKPKQTDFLPMPSLTADKDLGEKALDEKGKNSSKKQASKFAKSERAKNRRKRTVNLESDHENAESEKKRKLQTENDVDLTLPKINLKAKRPRTVRNKSRKTGKDKMAGDSDLAEGETEELQGGNESQKKKQNTNDQDEISETVSAVCANQELEDLSEKASLKSNKSKKKDDKANKELSTNNSFASPSRTRKRPQKQTSEKSPQKQTSKKSPQKQTSEKSPTQTKTDSDTDLSSAKKKQRQREDDHKMSPQNSSSGSKKQKQTAKTKMSKAGAKTKTPKSRPEPITKKERSHKKKN